jgi:Fur family ferric uptake transcriptional regulator
MLCDADLTPTPHRVQVLEAIGNSDKPLSPRDILGILRRRAINRVTVYRILDILVQNGLIDRLSAGERRFFYGLAPNPNHPSHPHFYCRGCGRLECLNAGGLPLAVADLMPAFEGRIERVEVRLDGLCQQCLAEAGKTGVKGKGG